jgi:hypothetical protein
LKEAATLSKMDIGEGFNTLETVGFNRYHKGEEEMKVPAHIKECIRKNAKANDIARKTDDVIRDW